ncbi:MAG: shikimate kinase [Candidatus Eremiobacteraeota bacterium]|nr:shikimate kinase [Candidatus Eremiobacteraeota bacterium]
MKRHVALTGFMASGKSTIGKRLARKMGLAFYDIDDLVVEQHGSIADIFYSQGEAAFRRYEYETIEGVVEHEPAGILALGGGAVTHEPTLKLLKKRSYRVFIKVPPEQILGRLRRSPRVRPLLGPTPSLSKIKELYTQRMPAYAHSDFTVEADDLTSNQIVEQIVDWMHKKKIAL